MHTGATEVLAVLQQRGVHVCFANPGTTELDVVRALETHPAMRCVLGLQENVCTGAADGYGRMTGTPALTLLHLGPGFANGIANLHNARRAHTPIINLIGDHMSWHLAYDAPLTSDIESLARPVSGWVRRITGTADAVAAAAEAVDRSHDNGGQGVTLIFPADYQAETVEAVRPPGAAADPSAAFTTAPRTDFDVTGCADRLRAARKVVFLLGGGGDTSGLGERAQQAAARLCDVLGATAYAETFPARAARGGGLPDFDRLPYFPEPARAVLDAADLIVLAGAPTPITYFGYDGHPSQLVENDRLLVLGTAGDDLATPLEALADALHAPAYTPQHHDIPGTEDGALTPAGIAATVARLLPAGVIVSVEGGTCGYPFYAASAGAARHTTLTNTGGAIGQGLPVALGAAVACPDRRVVALLSDGSTQYTIQTLWTLAHEALPVVVLIAANHQYGILRNELKRGGQALGDRATGLTSLDRPRIDWVDLAHAYGVDAASVETTGELAAAMTRALDRPGPTLIAMQL
ncbi:acetolactate synthase large subunit [Pigmentiphaga litoralis]|uniref:Acetolactate synthase-1/2/3 large subunit n=1 Tax=Pigmentiphaga litoralis TaxID=516702 RepID=A0A7Y9IRB4_9BURK|nr:acetolactate synthase large subunit [Pigmentiphaga litoralis]NYE24870.1 acetolactate synthase-1/2/3 large subunit [Pigmentiphaga litoralis]NYE81516.1 acetolactate synthase-1/2/3 large subunit [Pigmentiphaga litoralis]